MTIEPNPPPPNPPEDPPEYCWSNDAESFHGRHATRADAIEEAMSHTADGRQGQIETGIVIPHCAFSFFPGASDVIEHAANAAYDGCGDNAADWPDVSAEAVAELHVALSRVMQEWIAKHNIEPTFYSVGETQMISTITIDETEGTNEHGR